MDFVGIQEGAAAAYEKQGGSIRTAKDVLAYLALIHTEVSEATECIRKEIEESTAPDGKPEGMSSELADIVLRTMILAEALDVDLAGAIAKKYEYNVMKRKSLSEEGKMA